jgi:hypothetical protein
LPGLPEAGALVLPFHPATACVSVARLILRGMSGARTSQA